ncbi:unnamed protein product [Toxocara canis]|uniref:Uncharacterized protein n=1 Tax=Toxocara canis TaxID=6265 RepID=A0A183U060_TOXCA|nr:unnamed protein product [Toxocara canis]
MKYAVEKETHVVTNITWSELHQEPPKRAVSSLLLGQQRGHRERVPESFVRGYAAASCTFFDDPMSPPRAAKAANNTRIHGSEYLYEKRIYGSEYSQHGEPMQGQPCPVLREENTGQAGANRPRH